MWTARRLSPAGATPEVLVPRPGAALQVVIAVPGIRVARRIAADLLERRLGACVQTVGPIVSRYRWQGKMESAREFLLVVKTRVDLFPDIERAVARLHPYDVPEIVGMPLAPLHGPYLAWLRAETRGRSAPGDRRPASPARGAAGRIP
jgi:periplasmic divalent cation tolerance protein